MRRFRQRERKRPGLVVATATTETYSPCRRDPRNIAPLIRGDDTRTLRAREHRTSGAAIGKHVLADFWECTYEESAEYLLPLAVAAATAAGAEVFATQAHEFAVDGGGTTVLLLLAESHLSLHTWPEHAFVAVDVFTCGPGMSPERAIAHLVEQLAPAHTRIQVVDRGRDDR